MFVIIFHVFPPEFRTCGTLAAGLVMFLSPLQSRFSDNVMSFIIASDPMRVVRWSLYSRSSAEASLDPVVSQGEIEEPSQPSDKVNVPSTSQEPSSSSAGTEYTSAINGFIIGAATI